MPPTPPSPLTVSPVVPSILGPAAREVPIAPVSLLKNATVTTVHVLPAHLELDRLRDALEALTRLYPVICARVRRRPRPGGGHPYEYYYELTNSPFELAVVPAGNPSQPTPFASAVVMQPSTAPYCDLFPHAYFPNNDEPLFGAKVTRFDTYDVLGLSWAHVLSDGAGLNQFTKLLSRVYEGGPPLSEADWPDFGDHVKVNEWPSREVRERWDSRWSYPAWTAEALGELWIDSLKGTGVVQFVLSKAEVRRLRELATGDGPNGFVTEQDAITSYFLNLCRLQGVKVAKVSNTVSFRTFHRGHPAFPDTLPRLVANVAHLFTHPPFPASACTTSAPTSLRPFATHIRRTLVRLRTDPAACLDWLAVGALRYREAADAGLCQQPIPYGADGELVVNSNWGYKWHLPFGFSAADVAFHTTPPIARFLRVFEARDGGAELSWLLEEGIAARVLEEVARDRREGWTRWE